jgi:hypothetical protein
MMQHDALSEHTFHPTGPGLVSPPPPPPPPPPPAVPHGGSPQQRDELPAPEPKRRSATWLRPVLIAVAALVTVLIAVVAVALLLPPTEFAATALEMPDAVVSGDEVPVSVTLANESGAAGEQEVTILVDGERIESTTVRLAAGAQETVTLTVSDLAPGTYELSLAPWDLSGVVWVMTPPEFEIDAVSVTPSPLDINDRDQATVLVTVTNIGEAEGSYPLELTLDGELVDKRSVDLLDGGATTEESFDVTVDGPGSHEVAVDGVTAAFDVVQLERPANGTLLVNEVGGGVNQLNVTNNLTHDRVLVLAKPGDDSALLSVYLRGGGSHTVRGIRDGTYVTYFSGGSAWCTHNSRFTQDAIYGRFEGSGVYESTDSTHTVSIVEFGITDGAGEPTQGVSPDRFPEM